MWYARLIAKRRLRSLSFRGTNFTSAVLRPSFSVASQPCGNIDRTPPRERYRQQRPNGVPLSPVLGNHTRMTASGTSPFGCSTTARSGPARARPSCPKVSRLSYDRLTTEAARLSSVVSQIASWGSTRVMASAEASRVSMGALVRGSPYVPKEDHPSLLPFDFAGATSDRPQWWCRSQREVFDLSVGTDAPYEAGRPSPRPG